MSQRPIHTKVVQNGTKMNLRFFVANINKNNITSHLSEINTNQTQLDQSTIDELANELSNCFIESAEKKT